MTVSLAARGAFRVRGAERVETEANDRVEAQPPVHVKPASSTQHAVAGVRAVGRARGGFRKNTLEKKEAELVIAVPHVVIAHLTFSRGGSTQPLRG